MNCPLCLKQLVFDKFNNQWRCLEGYYNHFYSSSYGLNNNYSYYLTLFINIGEVSLYSFINETIISINKKTVASYPPVVSCETLEFINRIISLKAYM